VNRRFNLRSRRRTGAGPAPELPETNAEGGGGVAASTAGTAAADTDPGVAWLDGLPTEDALRELSACCASRRWTLWVAAARPYRDRSALLNEVFAALDALDWADVLEALAAHPMIGAHPMVGAPPMIGARPTTGTRSVIGRRAEQPADGEPQPREAAWSRAEQAGMVGADEEIASRLATLNLAYQEKFGHVFLICATGLPAEVMLRALEHRLPNDAAAEQRATRTELAAITRLRLERLLAHAEPTAEPTTELSTEPSTAATASGADAVTTTAAEVPA
jgi:2-oxo-4-hydroxy-4-carboxy-5-ureidoimidazoline decarboxylase